MKSSKNQLKAALKECLVELIEEGVFDEVMYDAIQEAATQTSKSMIRNQKKLVEHVLKSRAPTNSQPQSYPQRAAANDMVQQPQEPQQQFNPALQTKVQQISSQISKGDKKSAAVFSKIFEDTAKTTLQEQNGAEGPGGASPGAAVPQTPQQVQAERSQLEQLSGGKGMGHWAKVANLAAKGKK